MAVSEDIIRSDYPLPVYNYRVEIGDTTIACSSISGLNIGYNVTTFKQSRTETNMPGPKFMYMPALRVAKRIAALRKAATTIDV